MAEWNVSAGDELEKTADMAYKCTQQRAVIHTIEKKGEKAVGDCTSRSHWA
ncbi:unnamed protein product [Dovyalis caffra]|uniref:Uncharacterized protein n=1 Tax=Dovyalis caffra TaxID=77055 RepID=A0AAV1RTM2_9ROSI|nr:unnamed protein product [Dovyalis caffra]